MYRARSTHGQEYDEEIESFYYNYVPYQPDALNFELQSSFHPIRQVEAERGLGSTESV